VNIDFVLGLLKILRKFDSDLVVMDHFFKMTHFLVVELPTLLGLLRYSLMVLSNYMVSLRLLCSIELNSRVIFGKHFGTC